MGKKGGWFSSIKKVFTANSKDKPVNDSEKNDTKEKKKKKGIGKLRHGETTNSFIPLFRKPSSIEKIFGDFEREQQQQQQHNSTQTPKPSSFATTPRAPSPPRIVSPTRVVSPLSPPRNVVLPNNASAATRIQTAYRGFTARRSFRALKGLVRLQGVVRGQNVKRQTANAMKYMQLVVRVQSQIQARRIHMLESQARRQASNSKWNLATLSEAGSHGDWDDSVLTKEQVDVRMQKKVEAVIKRERAMAYAYSNQLWKSTQTTTDIRGFPWWYNWLDRQLPSSDQRPITPPIMDTQTPRSSRMARTPLSSHLRPPRGAREFEFPTTDDQSLTSCPPFSVPNYMTPTASAKAKAKVRGGSTDSKRRLSFPLWSKASNSVFSGNNTPNMNNRHSAAISVSNFSVDSAVSLPAAMSVPGRKPFNRFV